MSRSDPTAPACLVFCTVPDREVGLRLARGVVQGGLAACVNLLPGVTSVYSWKGEVQEDPEVLLILKTRPERLDALQEHILADHPYDTPEFVAVHAAHVSPEYLAWLQVSTT